MRVLVTGTGGYVGSLVATTLREDHDVIGVDKRSVEIDGIRQYKVNIAGGRAMDSLIGKVDMVAHLAAIPGVQDCREEPAAAIESNIAGTGNIARACYHHEVPLVFASTIGLYGDKRYITPHTDRPAPTFYAKTKRTGEDIIEALARDAYPAISLQMSNLYGVHFVDGQWKFKPTVVNHFIKLAEHGMDLTVHRPGDQSRDFLHVSDAADGWRRAIERVWDFDPGMTAMPLATGTLHTVREVAEMVQTAAFADIDIELVDHPGEPYNTGLIDTTRAKKLLGFQPAYTVEDHIKEELG